jgi:hypothetical protein
MLNYKQLIENFQQYFLPENKKLSMINYMKNNCDYIFTNDIIEILNNYNSIILQSIQAIRNLIFENENKNYNDYKNNNCIINQYYPKENYSKLNYEYNKNNNSQIFFPKPLNNNYENRNEIINIKTNLLKKPLRDTIKFQSSHQRNRNNKLNLNPIKSLTPNTSLRILLSSKRNENKRNHTINYYKSISKEKKKELEIIKKTNDILKLIEMTSKHKKLFNDKYIGINKNEIDINYKNFLDNIINYKYNIDTLKNIYDDILNLCVKSSINKKPKVNKSNFSNIYSKKKIQKKEFENTYSNSQDSFEKSLRKFDSFNLYNRKQFNNYFDSYNNNIY